MIVALPAAVREALDFLDPPATIDRPNTSRRLPMMLP
jgi:hypothetical protein